jgi:hypothetical protein
MVSRKDFNIGKELYIEEVASMKSLELFGITSCNVTWYDLFKKHLAFDVLKCPTLDCETQECLSNEITKKL